MLNARTFTFLKDAASTEGKTSIYSSKIADLLEKQGLVLRTDWETVSKRDRIWVTTPAGNAVLAKIEEASQTPQQQAA